MRQPDCVPDDGVQAGDVGSETMEALNGAKLLADVIDGVAFEDGVKKEAA